MSLTLGIIGTAGRGADATKLTKGHYTLMRSVAQTLAMGLRAERLVSGGAAWADALAVDLYLRGVAPSLLLHLPCRFNAEDREYDPSTRVGQTCNHYHAAASFTLGWDGREQIWEVMNRDRDSWMVTEEAASPTGFGGFFARNARVATTADVMLAFTFGEEGKSGLKDGGTSHTMETFLKRRFPVDDTTSLGGFTAPAYHYNLTDKILYRL